MKARLTPIGTLLFELPATHPRAAHYLAGEAGSRAKARNGTVLVELAPAHPRYTELLEAFQSAIPEQPGFTGVKVERVRGAGGKFYTRRQYYRDGRPVAGPHELPEPLRQAHIDYEQNGTRAKAFKEWFGDWETDPEHSSKVVSKNGEPQETHPISGEGSVVHSKQGPTVVYHGTHHGGFEEFDETKVSDKNLYGPGFYFTEDESVAKQYEEKGVPQELDRPFVEEDGSFSEDDMDRLKIVSDHFRGKVPWHFGGKVAWVKAGYDPGPKGLSDYLANQDFAGKDELLAKLKTKLQPKSGLIPKTFECYLNIRRPFDLEGPNPSSEVFSQLAQAVKPLMDAPEYLYNDLSKRLADKASNPESLLYKGVPDNAKGLWSELSSSLGPAGANKVLTSIGYDGLTHIGGSIMGKGHKHRVWIAFQPTQVKSIHNAGTFSPSKRNVYEAKEPESHDYSSTQLNLPPEIASGIRGIGRCIEDEHLSVEGREQQPHVTVLYGLHTLDSEEVRRQVQGFGPITLTLGPVSLFPAREASAQRGGDQQDVVKIDVVECPRLHALHQLLSKLEHTDTHPDYLPHITLAYCKPGQGARYLWGEHALQGKQLTVTTLTFSPPEGNGTEIDLCGPKLTPLVESPEVIGILALPAIELVDDASPFSTQRPYTIAVDLDGTLAEDCGHSTNSPSLPPPGTPRPDAKGLMELLHAAGHTLILWTCRGNESEVREWLVEHGIPFDYINENPKQPSGTSQKLYADIYLDDRGVAAKGPLGQVAAALAGRLHEMDKKHKEGQSTEVLDTSLLEADSHVPFTGIDAHGHEWVNGRQIRRHDLEPVPISHEQWRKSVPNETEEAINAYLGTSYMSINQTLRGEPDPFADDDDPGRAKRIQEYIKNLDNAFASVPATTHPIQVIRGVSPSKGTATEQLYEKLQSGEGVGLELTDPAYQSTSLYDPRYGETSAHGKITLRFVVPAGSKAILGRDFHKQDNEVILPRGAKYVVQRVASVGDRLVLDVSYAHENIQNIHESLTRTDDQQFKDLVAALSAAPASKYKDGVVNPLPYREIPRAKQDALVHLAVATLTPEQWRQLLQPISLTDLHSAQRWVTRGKLLATYADQLYHPSTPRKVHHQHPIALLEPGQPPTLLDGNHRAVVELLGSSSTVECYCIDEHGNPAPYTPTTPTGGLLDEVPDDASVEILESLTNWHLPPGTRCYEISLLEAGFTGIVQGTLRGLPHLWKYVNGRRQGSAEAKPEPTSTSHYSVDVANIPTTLADHKEAEAKADTLWARMAPGTKSAWAGMLSVGHALMGRVVPYGKHVYHTAETPFRKGREMALAAAKARGATEEEITRLARILGMADMITAWTVNFPVVTAATGNPVLGKASSWFPMASACYLAYSTSRNPIKTLKAAAQALRSTAFHTALKSSKHRGSERSLHEALEVMEAKQTEGIPFQGPSGRWFVLRDHRPVPTKAPGSGGTSYTQAIQEKEVDKDLLKESEGIVDSALPTWMSGPFVHPAKHHPIIGPAMKVVGDLSQIIGWGHKDRMDSRGDNNPRQLAIYLIYRLLSGDSDKWPQEASRAVEVLEWAHRGNWKQSINRLIEDVRNPLPTVLHRVASIATYNTKDLSTEFPGISGANKARVTTAYEQISPGNWIPGWIVHTGNTRLRPLTQSESVELGHTAPEDIVTQLISHVENGDGAAKECLDRIKDINNLQQVAEAACLYSLHRDAQYYPVINQKMEELNKGKGRKGLNLKTLQQLDGWLASKRAQVKEISVEDVESLMRRVDRYLVEEIEGARHLVITINQPKDKAEVPPMAGDYVRFTNSKNGHPFLLGQIENRADGKSGWGPLSLDQDDTHYHIRIRINPGENPFAKITNGVDNRVDTKDLLRPMTNEEKDKAYKGVDMRKAVAPSRKLDGRSIETTESLLLIDSVELPSVELLEAGTFVGSSSSAALPGYTGVKIEHVQGPYGTYTRRVYYVNGKQVEGPHEMPQGWTSKGPLQTPPSQEPQEKTEHSPPPPPEPIEATKLAGTKPTGSPVLLYPDKGPTPPSTDHTGAYHTKTHQHLAEAPITKMESIGRGINDPQLVTFEDGAKGVWKPETTEDHTARAAVKGKLWRREVANSQVADLLHYNDMVPATVARTVGTARGSMKKFVEGVVNASQVTVRDAQGKIQQDPRVYDGPFHLVDLGYTNPDTHEDAETLRDIDGELRKVVTRNQLLEQAVKEGLNIPEEVAQWGELYDSIYDTYGHNGITGPDRALTLDRLDSLVTAAKAGKTIGELWQEAPLEVINDMPDPKTVERYYQKRTPLNTPGRRNLARAAVFGYLIGDLDMHRNNWMVPADKKE